MLSSQIHKRINFNFDKQKLIFDTSQELFSFAKIDDGTKELLNSLRKNPQLNYEKILDLGCGYGPIGIYLKNKFQKSEVLCADRDSLAVAFAKHNADLNKVKIETIPSLDFIGVSGRFSLIITNFPAKLEKQGLEYFIAKSSKYLLKEGTLALVIVKELNNSMEEILKNEKITVCFKEKSKNYSVYHLQFKEVLEDIAFSYQNNSLKFEIEEKTFLMKTSNAMQEFDNPHFITELIIEKLVKHKLENKIIVIVNPNQGFIPVSLINHNPGKIILVSRDLLQLDLSSKNLSENSFNSFEELNSDFPQIKGDLLIWSLHDEGHKEVLEKLEVYRKNFKKILLGGRIQIINRVLQVLKLEPKKEILGKYCVVEI